MSETPDTFESLAVRHLDGELTADEQSQLYRLMMRDPQKRREVERARRLDQSVAKALHAVLDAPSRPVRIGALPRQQSSHRWLGLQLLATAALMLLAVGVWQLQATKDRGEKVNANSLATAGLAVVAPRSPMPNVEVAPTFATTDEASLALTPPRLPDVTASSAMSSAPMGEMWWRKPHAAVVVATPARSESASAGGETKAAKPQHYWTTLLEALDPSGKRFEMFKQQPGAGSSPNQPVVNSVSGEM